MFSSTRFRHYATLGLILLAAGLLLLVDLLLTANGNRFLQTLVGWGAAPLAAIMVMIGAFLVWQRRLASWLGSQWYAEALLGLLLLFVAALTGLHLALGQDSYLDAQAGRGGGMVGWALADLLTQTLGRTGAWFIALLTAFIGLILLAIYTPLRNLWSRPLPGQPRQPRPPLKKQETEDRGRRAESKEPVLSAAKGQKSEKEGQKAASGRQKPCPATASTPLKDTGRTPPPPRSPVTAPLRPAAAPPETTARTAPPPAPSRRSKKLPPLDLLHSDDKGGSSNEQAAIQAAIIEDTLASFGIPAKIVETNIGPTVTQFGVAPGNIQRNDRITRVRVNQIVALDDDLALALSASPIRIEAPVPGRPYVGIEVPNPDATLVSLRRLLQDRNFKKIGSPLAIPFGRDVSGAIVAADLHKLPHLLVAGATGSGKSVALNAIICSLLFNNTPDTLRLILIDPKRVEFPGYNGLPHLVAPVVVDPEQAGGALSWLLLEMDDRYHRFSAKGVRNIGAFNESASPAERLPYLVLVVDELADLMVTAPDVIEAKLVRLAQMARATGIHLVVATQRPSVDVVTGLIKANFPARLAFAVASQIDSRVIIDTPGAEKLLGRGDGLLMTADSAKLRRIQGCFVSDSEINELVRWWQTNSPALPPDPTKPRYPWSQLLVEEATANDLMDQAIDKLRSRQTISVSGLQRLLGIGYPRAARLMQELEAAGIVGPDTDRRLGRPVLLEEEDLSE